MAPTTTTKTAAPKTANGAGVKKGPGRKTKNTKAKAAMIKMQAFCEFLMFDA
jgi:hypothetical protein